MKKRLRELKRIRAACGPVGGLAYVSYRFGNWAHYRGPRLLRKPFRAVYLFLDFWIIRVMAGARLPAETRIGERVGFVHDAQGLVLHPRVVIGDDVTIYHQVTIGTMTNEPIPPRIGNGVLIGAGAKILGNITIGDYAAIGANAVVFVDVPEGASAVGNPARIVPAKPGWFHSPRR